MTTPTSEGVHILTATYQSSGTQETVHVPIESSLPTGSATVKDKTTYLGALRTSVSQLQDEINQFLTRKMEEDKRAIDGDDGDKQGTALNVAEEVEEDE